MAAFKQADTGPKFTSVNEARNCLWSYRLLSTVGSAMEPHQLNRQVCCKLKPYKN